MKGYLLLENGISFKGKIISDSKNILGNVLLDNKGNINLKCNKTKECSLIVNNPNDTSADMLLSDIDFKNLKLIVEKCSGFQGKIVTDSLPIEYHVYDLKTYIPV